MKVDKKIIEMLKSPVNFFYLLNEKKNEYENTKTTLLMTEVN